MSFSVSDGRGGFEWAATPIGLFANLGHIIDPSFHRMLFDLRRFFREARELIGTNGDGPSLREFCETRGYSEYFVERLIVPQVSAVWSADPEQLWTFPASFIAEFFANHGSLQLLGRPRWHTVTGGSRRYVDAITAPFAERIRTGGARGLGPPRRRRGGDRVGRRNRAVRQRRLRLSLRPGAGDAGRPDRRRARGPGRYRLPGERDRAAHGPVADAAPPRGVGQLELSPQR